MSSELSKLAERLRQQQQARLGKIIDDVDQVAAFAARRGTPHVVGDRVFDPITGEEGVVIIGTRENVIVPAAKR